MEVESKVTNETVFKFRTFTTENRQDGKSGVVVLKHDANGKPIIRSNQNLLIDTQCYEVDFPRGETTETELVFAQCNIHFLFNAQCRGSESTSQWKSDH